MKSLYPAKRKPYYIVTPRYVRTSAGIRALHLLCHWLNRIGEEAYVYIQPDWDGEATRYGFLTPVLTETIVAHHLSEERDPIVIFSETATTNILQAQNVVRFFGHFPGHLEKFNTLHEKELHFSYSSALAKATRNPDNVLFIPTIDTNIFHPSASNDVRSGTVYYAAKFKTVHQQDVFGLPNDCFEIKRDTPDQLNQYELATLFRRSELLYCFEDSAIANEAALCGCPVVLMGNPYFERPIAIDEVGWDGYAWGNSDAEIKRARDTVAYVAQRYQKCVNEFDQQLVKFVSMSQKYFDQSHKLNSVTWPRDSIGTLDKPSDRMMGRRVPPSLRSLAYAIPLLGARLKDRARLYEENEVLKRQLKKCQQGRVSLPKPPESL